MKFDEGGGKDPRKLLTKRDAKPSMFINDISKLFMQKVRRECEKSGISHGYHKLLMELSHNEGATQLQLVKLTHLSAPTVSVALGKMESEGLVTRQTDPGDMRAVKVFLTDKGSQKVRQVRKTFREADGIVVKGLSEEEIATAMAVLRKMLINLLEEEDR